MSLKNDICFDDGNLVYFSKKLIWLKADFEPIYTADEFVNIPDFDDKCKELTELDLINRYTKSYIEEEGSSDEDDLQISK
jgi:hypothetical protein